MKLVNGQQTSSQAATAAVLVPSESINFNAGLLIDTRKPFVTSEKPTPTAESDANVGGNDSV
jgi:hypothetical protein